MIETIFYASVLWLTFWFCFRDPPPPSDDFKDNTNKLNGGLM